MALKKYDAAIIEYKLLLNQKERRFKHVYSYNLACAFAQSHQLDSALDILIKNPELTQSADFIFDHDLLNLHGHIKWGLLLDKYQQNFILQNHHLPYCDVAYELSLMKEEGQSIRRISVREFNSPKTKDTFLLKWKEIDSVNTSKLVKIIEKIGWPDVTKVGSTGAYNAFLVLQHADSFTQKKYIGLLRKAVAENRASPTHLAYLEDRLLQLDNKPQLYGTQIDITGNKPKPYPVIEPDKLNERRKSVGLEPIEEYLKSFE